MKGFISILDGLADFEEIIGGLKKGQSPVSVTGVADSVRSHLIFCLSEKLGKGALVVAADESHAKILYEDMRYFFDGNAVLFPQKDLMFYDIEAAANDIKKNRIDVVDRLCRGERPCIVTTVDALLSATVPREVYERKTRSLKIGDEIEIDELCELMCDMGYRREEMVEGRGQFSVRGGIVDYFPYWSETAFRIEFFDTEVDSIRRFSAETQRTIMSDVQVEEARITPADEILTDAASRCRVANALREIFKKLGECDDETKNKLAKTLARDAERMEGGVAFPSRDKYIPLIYNEKIPTLLDYIGDDYTVFLDDPERISETVTANERANGERLKDMIERGIVPGGISKFGADYSETLAAASRAGLVGLSAFSRSHMGFKPKCTVNFTAKSLNDYNGKMEFFYDALEFYRKNKYRTVILAGSARRAENLHKQLENDGISTTLEKEFDELPEQGHIVITHGGLSRGFEYPLIRFVIISDKEIFGRERKKRKRFKVDKKNKIDSFTDLKPGDFVVHQNHGIGQYEGLNRLSVEGVEKDYLKIVYKGGDSLYVPADQLNLIYKHIGRDNSAVHMNRLGGQEWNRAKQRVKDSCRDMAQQLISLYAQRECVKGIAFSPDTEWQRDFEAAFPYDETDDQLRSIAEVKADMEKPSPMERLLCGDVGYGKTEVAMRAAFKAVMDGYQVAYLVPTTILASQHYNNFRQRMKDYPVNIACLSRFCTAGQQKQIISGLKSGEVDIVIGTHKLLQKSVKYKKLGLLIIDEEQRFGVAHKERIKEMKKEIDVLTLSATPIPRTLHMSMSGIRDMSIIAEPPGERYPVATYVMEYDRDIIREAIVKELGRGGQVYYLHNRVQGIESAAAEIADMVPGVRVATAHGKMSEHELENIMLDVSEGETDVLVCTTIIETGLDIPNVNTIIIEDADRLGLSQLYQLRGRVGRSNRLAYAYLTFRRDKTLNEDAQKRLRAIKEFTEFGSGFKIALRDLEIRGTGNVIGPQQSGHMESVGYEMYCKLLSDTVSELRGETIEETVEASVDLPVNAFIPEKYIKAHSQRLSAYKRIAAIETEEDLGDAYDELLDRYGDVPISVCNLMEIALIKKYASDRRFTEIKGTLSAVELHFDPNNAPDFSRFGELDELRTLAVALRNGTKPKLVLNIAKCAALRDEKNIKDNYLNIIKEFIKKL